MRGKFPGDELYLVGLNESPSEKEGKCRSRGFPPRSTLRLNESPSEKEGKYST